MKETPDKEKGYGIVLLGAGNSSRLGSPKQLLVFNGVTLVRRTAKIALEITGKVVAVTGARAMEVEEELANLPLIIILNKNFNEGIASSIRLGLSTLIKEAAGLKGAIFIVCDQPYLTTEVLDQLINSAEDTQKGIVACSYGGTVGIPALFKQAYFSEILELEGDAGAKKLIMNHIPDVVSIAFPKGYIDIDTLEDWQNLKTKNTS